MTGDMAMGLGNAATGLLAARAVDDPLAATPAQGHAHGHDALCLNCGTRLVGTHCHACGQHGHVHRTLGAIGHEIAHGVFHFEGKIWRTLPMLVWRPGELTRRYVAGERVRFVAPLALFLFTVFLMFAAINAVAGGFGVEDAPARQSRVAAESRRQLDRVEAERTRLVRERAAAVAANRPVAEIDDKLRILAITNEGLRFARPDTGSFDVHTGWRSIDHGIDKATKNPALIVYKLQTSAYKYSWALIPLSIPFVAMLFLWRRRFGLYDHAIFVTYSISFMMLLVIVLTLAGAAGLSDGWIVWPALLAPPIHMYRQLRGAYELRRFSALWRTAVLLIFAFVALTLFGTALVVNGLSH